MDVLNAEAPSPFVLVCEHASSRIPAEYGDMGLSPSERLSPAAWDAGALELAKALMRQLDAPLVAATVSRLVIDAARAPEASDLIPTQWEDEHIAANESLGAAERAERLARFHAPFHAAVAALLDRRLAERRETILVSLHAFSSTASGAARPWTVRLLRGREPRFAEGVGAALAAEAPEAVIALGEAHAALCGPVETLERHGDGRGLASVLVEMRQDAILAPDGMALWAGRLARALAAARAAGAALPGGAPLAGAG